jgi:seryl-tRNA synthetase
MLDIKFIRDNKDIVQSAAHKKRIKFDVHELLKVDDERLRALADFETLRAEQNQISNRISVEKDATVRMQMIEEMKLLKEEVKSKEDALREVMKTWQTLMVSVPNVPDITVPEGESDADNQEVKVWGEKPNFDFQPKDHMSLMENLDMADFERGTKVAGFRGYFLKNEGALLEMALWQFFMESLVLKGFTPMIAPSMVNKETLYGTGYLPQGEEDLYKNQDDKYLAGTGEVATMSYFSNEILDKKELPIKIAAFSPCFRREAGAHSKDVKGLYRVHEFMKLEQIVLCEASHEESVKYHEEITANVEELLQALEIPYHIVLNCGGDLGLGQVKKYDIECWVPSQGKYGETHSASYFHDFQTRRLNIRYKDDEGKNRYVHSLNNTAVATPRILISLVENYQNQDGSVRVPKVLQKYIGKEIINK